MRGWMAIGLGLLVAMPAWAGPPSLGRLGITFYGAPALQPQAPSTFGPSRDVVMGCGGLGGAWIPEQAVKRKRGWRVLPANQRFTASVIDICNGIGAGTDSVWMAPLQFGYGGQWGGEVLYLTAQLEGGVGAYWEEEGPGKYSVVGLSARPRAALGIQAGPVQVEVGPTARLLAPLYTRFHNAERGDGVFKGIGSFDVAVHFGAVGPHRWY